MYDQKPFFTYESSRVSINFSTKPANRSVFPNVRKSFSKQFKTYAQAYARFPDIVVSLTVLVLWPRAYHNPWPASDVKQFDYKMLLFFSRLMRAEYRSELFRLNRLLLTLSYRVVLEERDSRGGNIIIGFGLGECHRNIGSASNT